VERLTVRVIDLCSGAGCFAEGFRQAGFEVVLGVDNWEVAAKSFGKNFGEYWIKDITTLNPIDLPECDVVIGSPPCQEWSTGKAEKRTYDLTIITAFQKIIAQLKPLYWIWECAPETAKLDKAPVLNAYDFGVPQIRKRAFHANFPLPKFAEQGKCLNEVFGWAETKVLYNHRSLNENAYSPVYLSNRPARTAVTWPIRIYKEQPFTVDMMKQVQTIPQSFKLCGSQADQYKQIGNAVPTRQAYHIAAALLQYHRGLNQ
jgi:site-specific DNA-cytosine methylase